jgi:threonine/homoserine/homoserine lactone efflux protein
VSGVSAYLAAEKTRCHVLEFILTVLLLELTPGPNMAYLATLALDQGRRAGLLATVGVATGLSVHAIVAALGLGALISQAPLVYDLLRWIGVVYLLYLAWETWQSNEKEHPAATGAANSSLFWRGFFSNLFNPKSILFFVSVVPGFIGYEPSASSLLVQAGAAGGDLHWNSKHHPYGHRIARKPTEIAADRWVAPEIGSAVTVTCAVAGRGVACLVDAPRVTGSPSTCAVSWRV